MVKALIGLAGVLLGLGIGWETAFWCVRVAVRQGKVILKDGL